jgi:ribonucleoside-diphosphate reductase protein NrdI
VRDLLSSILPTYCGDDGKGAVPKQVIRFLNNADNRSLIRGVIAAGNSNFGETFGLAGNVISDKCRVPYLYRFELLGTDEDVANVIRWIGTILDVSTLERPLKATETAIDYHALNAMLNLYDDEGKIQLDKDRLAAKQYFLQHVNQNTVFFHNLREKLDYLVTEGLLRARGSRPVFVQLRARSVRSRLCEEVPLPDLPRGVQVLHQLHAEDL